MTTLREAAELRPPAAALVESLLGFILSRAIVVAVKLGIADLLAEGPRTAGELAARAGADEKALYRLLRALASYGIFREPAPRRFALNDVAELLCADSERSLRDPQRRCRSRRVPKEGDLTGVIVRPERRERSAVHHDAA